MQLHRSDAGEYIIHAVRLHIVHYGEAGAVGSVGVAWSATASQQLIVAFIFIVQHVNVGLQPLNALRSLPSRRGLPTSEDRIYTFPIL